VPSKSRSPRKPATRRKPRAKKSAASVARARTAVSRRATPLAARGRAIRVVDAPWELEQELRNDAHARDAYEAMPASHRKAYVQFIEDAKRPETRVRRVQQALRMMAQWSAEHRPRKAKKR
jgi:hypothetical protein